MKARFRLTVLAEADFDEAGGYTLETWGDEQADRYLTQFNETFAMLANTPSLGEISAI
ncbi:MULTISPECIES: type II toxin-antitoxin system RelE/ParE family toxin [Mesorhizobium]|uniref:type II toxin-antitoxin system RelE/ParE family toxin n=1 Tax=Mesorhizobium sp. GR13 TaxID=2562308 RepID=UPI0018F642EA|nr:MULTISPECIES: type II toxin-antitoxin system RelE/ParE family toxin [Mesorhizobium]